MEEFFEYAVQIERPGHRVQVIEYGRFHGDAKALRDVEALTWGDDKVHLLTRWVTRTPWQEATNIPAAPQQAASHPPAPPDRSSGGGEPSWVTAARQDPAVTNVVPSGEFL